MTVLIAIFNNDSKCVAYTSAHPVNEFNMTKTNKTFGCTVCGLKYVTAHLEADADENLHSCAVYKRPPDFEVTRSISLTQFKKMMIWKESFAKNIHFNEDDQTSMSVMITKAGSIVVKC